MRRLLFSLLLLLSAATPVLAAEPLIFKDKTDDVRALEMLELLRDTSNFQIDAPYRIAPYDLNGDGVAEWIIEQGPEACAARAMCRFFIGGLSERKPVLLGQFYASKVAIRDVKPNGINQLAVYADPNNDFEYKTYEWSPDKRGFFPL